MAERQLIDIIHDEPPVDIGSRDGPRSIEVVGIDVIGAADKSFVDIVDQLGSREGRLEQQTIRKRPLRPQSEAVVNRITDRGASLADAGILRIGHQQRSSTHIQRTHRSGGDLAIERVGNQIVQLIAEGEILRERRVTREVVPDMHAAAADIGSFDQEVSADVALDVGVPLLVFGSEPFRENRADAIADQGIGVRQKTGHERIGERSSGNRRIGRCRRLTEEDASADRRSATQIAGARTDTSAARSIKPAISGPKHSIGQEGPCQAYPWRPVLVRVARIAVRAGGGEQNALQPRDRLCPARIEVSQVIVALFKRGLIFVANA